MKDNFCNQDVINETAEKLETPKFLIKRIENHWHNFVHNTIISGNFENVLVPFLIKIEFNQKKMDAINYRKAKNNKL